MLKVVKLSKDRHVKIHLGCLWWCWVLLIHCSLKGGRGLLKDSGMPLTEKLGPQEEFHIWWGVCVCVCVCVCVLQGKPVHMGYEYFFILIIS